MKELTLSSIVLGLFFKTDGIARCFRNSFMCEEAPQGGLNVPANTCHDAFVIPRYPNNLL
jgi:hypothetical protein